MVIKRFLIILVLVITLALSLWLIYRGVYFKKMDNPNTNQTVNLETPSTLFGRYLDSSSSNMNTGGLAPVESLDDMFYAKTYSLGLPYSCKSRDYGDKTNSKQLVANAQADYARLKELSGINDKTSGVTYIKSLSVDTGDGNCAFLFAVKDALKLIVYETEKGYETVNFE